MPALSIDNFDDVIIDDNGIWSQVCTTCAQRHDFDDAKLTPEGEGSGLCGVSGCELEAEHYIDFQLTVEVTNA